MKKILSLMLALLMLAVPVLSMAEAPAAEAVPSFPARQNFTTKYLTEGQQETLDISIRLGDGAISALPEPLQTPVKDLLEVLKIETSGQTIDQMAQGSLRLLLNDQKAADVTLAFSKDGIYAGSSFLGEKILKVTPDQLKNLAKQAAGSMGFGEQLENLETVAAEFSKDPQAFIAKLVGDANPEKLLAALQEVVGETKVEMLTESPENIPFTAEVLSTLPIRKEGLKKAASELGSFLWSMPIVQQLAQSMPGPGGAALTEETLVGTLTSAMDLLKDDFEVKGYLNTTGTAMAFLTEPVLVNGDNEVRLPLMLTLERREDGVQITWNLAANNEGQQSEIGVKGEMNVVMAGADGSMAMKNAVSMANSGNSITILDENVDAAWTMTETSVKMNMNERISATDMSEGTTQTAQVSMDAESQDLGDHAEEAVTVTVTVDGIGELMTVTVNGKTSPAEAYIISDSAVEPLSMNEEELGAFQEELGDSISNGLTSLLQAVPESVRNLVMSLMIQSQSAPAGDASEAVPEEAVEEAPAEAEAEAADEVVEEAADEIVDEIVEEVTENYVND